MTVGAVDCNEEKNKQLCMRFQLQGFPTIKVGAGGLEIEVAPSLPPVCVGWTNACAMSSMHVHACVCACVRVCAWGEGEGQCAVHYDNLSSA